MIGVYDKRLCEIFADVLIGLKYDRAIVLHGDGLDEASVCSSTYIMEINDNNKNSYEINPLDFGIKPADIKELKGGDAKENAIIIKEILSGKISAKADCVILNSAIALYTAKIAGSIKEGILMSQDAVSSKKALDKLEQFIKVSNG